MGMYYMYMYIAHSVYKFAGHHLATKVFIGKLLAIRGVWVIIG